MGMAMEEERGTIVIGWGTFRSEEETLSISASLFKCGAPYFGIE